MRTAGKYPVLDKTLEFARHVRSDESPFTALGNVTTGGSVFLGPDDWIINGPMTIDRKVYLFGRGSTIEMEAGVLGNSDAMISINASDVVIHRVKFTSENKTGRAIFINADRIRITECEFDGFDVGVFVSQSSFCKITDNTFTNCGSYGIFVNRSVGCAIQDNFVTDNPPDNGIFMDATTSNSLVTGNILPTGSIEYTHNSTNQPDTAARAGFTNVANSITVN